MNYFFITGLPRSRTSWLANLLTYGPSFCLHDGIQHGLGAASLLAAMGRAGSPLPADRPERSAESDRRAAECAPYLGDADSGLPLIAEDLDRLCPAARWVFVARPRPAAEASFLSYFATHQYRNSPELSAGLVHEAFDLLQSRLDQCRARIPAARRLDVTFAGLNQDIWVRAVWEHCVPGEPFNAARARLLQKLRINPAADKVDAARLLADLEVAA